MKDDVALLFVTIDRPDAAQRFVFSIRERFPDLPIHVADQTEPSELMRAFYATHGVNVLWMPHDSGVCECRNALVAATTSEYLFLCDDDLIFTKDTDYSGPLEILARDPQIGIVGGRWVDRYANDFERVRHWALFLHVDTKNELLTGVPAYHYMPNGRHAGVHKYFLCDTALNFALFRRSVFDDPRVRWDPRFQCNGEHEDFYLNFKAASRYLVAYYPGLVCVHSRPRAAAYERLRERSEGWRRFMEKWGVKQYCELELGTRTIIEPDKVHRERTWRDYLTGVGLTSEREFQNDAYEVSLTDDWQVILANHYDPHTGKLLRRERSKAKLFLNSRGELLSAGEEVEVEPDEDEVRALAVQKIARERRNVVMRFRAPLDAPAGSEVLATVEIENGTGHLLPIGQNSPAKAKFVCRFRRGDSIVMPWDDATACYADLPAGVHQQLLGFQVPEAPGVYELQIALVAGEEVVLGEPSLSLLEVTPRRAITRFGPLDTPRVESGHAAHDATDDEESALKRLCFIRDHVRMAPERAGAGAARSLVPVTIECRAGAAPVHTDLLLTCHWKKDGRYVAWDVERHTVSGICEGRSVRAVQLARPVDPTLDIEVAAVVPGAGYVPMFEVRNATIKYATSSSISVSAGK